MKKKKGFTLIELLAVMVILAVISLIAIPLVLNAVSESRKGTLRSSYQSLLKAIDMDKTYDTIDYSKMYIVTDGVLKPDLKYDGELQGTGIITVDAKGKVKIKVETDEWCISKRYDENKVNVFDGICAVEADENHTEYTYLPTLKNELVKGTKKVIDEAGLRYDEASGGMVYSGTETEFITPITIHNQVVTTFGFLETPYGTPYLASQIYFAQGLQTVLERAFQNQTNVTKIFFPPTLESLDSEVFVGTTSLTEITFSSQTVPKIFTGTDGTFKGLKNTTKIRVPKAQVGEYQKAWQASLPAGTQIIGY